MNDDDLNDDDRQWTPEAREGYRRSLAEAAAALAEHGELVLGREGRQAEHQAYFASGERLARALHALTESEFDWCGSTPFNLTDFEDDDFDDEDEDEELGDGDDLVVGYQGRLHVTDRAALITEGRAAYRRIWPDHTAEDAEHVVGNPAEALTAIMHDRGFEFLDELPHVEETEFELRVRTSVVAVDGPVAEEDVEGG